MQVLSQRPALEGDEALGGGGDEAGPNQAFRLGDATYAFQYHWEVGRTIASQWWQEFAAGLHDSRGGAWRGAMASGLAVHNARGHVEAAERFAHAMALGWVELCAQRRRQRAAGKS